MPVFTLLPEKGGGFFYVSVGVRIPQMEMKPDEEEKENRES